MIGVGDLILVGMHRRGTSSAASGSSSSASSSPGGALGRGPDATSRTIEDLRVADVMDAEPVAIPSGMPLDRRRHDTSCATAGRGSRWSTRAAGSSAWCRARPSSSVPERIRARAAGGGGHGRATTAASSLRVRSTSRSRRCSAHEGLARLGRADGRGRRRRAARDRDHGPGPARAAAGRAGDAPRASSSTVHRIATASMPEHDVLVIGAGLAGQRAALARRRGGRVRRDHLQGPPGPLALERGPGRHQRGARTRRTPGSRTPSTRSRAPTTSATRTRSRSCAARRPRSCSTSSTWASPSTATRRAGSARAPSAAPRRPAPTTWPTSPARRSCTCSTSSS